MNIKTRFILLLIVLFGCERKPDKMEIIDRLTRYGNFIKTGEPDSLASFYLPLGSLAGEGVKPIVSPDSISRFLRQFVDFHVLEYSISTDSIQSKNDTTLSFGSYFQKVVIPSGDTLELGGRISCRWIYFHHQWMLENLYTYNYEDRKKKKK